VESNRSACTHVWSADVLLSLSLSLDLSLSISRSLSLSLSLYLSLSHSISRSFSISRSLSLSLNFLEQRPPQMRQGRPERDFSAITRDEMRSLTKKLHQHICRAGNVLTVVPSRCTSPSCSVHARIRICVHSHVTQMDRAMSIMMGMCRVHTSPASIMLPLIPQRLVLPLFKTCMLWSLLESKTSTPPPTQSCCLQNAAVPPAESSRSAWGCCAHDFSLSHTLTLSLSRVLFLFLSHRNFHDCPCEQDKHTYSRTTRHQLQCSPV